MNKPSMNYIFRPSGDPSAYTILLLHGTGGDEHSLLQAGGRFGPGVNLLGLRGSVSEGGMLRFFRRKSMGVFDEEDLIFRTHEMVAFIRELAEIEHFDLRKIIALGYSNGANIAGGTLTLYPDFLAGAVLFRPMQPFREMPEVRSSNAVPVFLSHGIQDLTVSRVASERYDNWLEASGFGVSSHYPEAGHELTHPDLQLSVRWFEAQFTGTHG